MRIMIVDNYDSFVHNVAGVLRVCRGSVAGDLDWDIFRNDRIPFDRLGDYDAAILSPGPGVPEEAGDMMHLLEVASSSLPMLGICLGHQALALHFGARLRQLDRPRHGHPAILESIDSTDPVIGPLAGESVQVGRYHSWTVDTESLPDCLTATSYDTEGNIMSLRHRTLPLFGLQFHPESIITPAGSRIISNFLTIFATEQGQIP